MMESFFISYKSSQIHGFKAGTGKTCLFCFHGYGDTAASFEWLATKIQHEFTLIAIDLPLHGQTCWNEGLTFSPEDLLRIINEIALPNASKIYLLGFSMGGRIALHLLQLIAAKTQKVILLAPDGFRTRLEYWLATQSFFGRRLFVFTMQHPGWLFLLLQVGNKARLINNSMLKFTNVYLHDRESRCVLHDRWITMRRFKPSIKQIKAAVKLNGIKIRLLYGKYDKVIDHLDGKKFMRGIEPNCILSIINTGHLLLQEKNAEEIIRLIKN
jgi:pimeloyl-ACP methyl ester carboxylesterase